MNEDQQGSFRGCATEIRTDKGGGVYHIVVGMAVQMEERCQRFLVNVTTL